MDRWFAAKRRGMILVGFIHAGIADRKEQNTYHLWKRLGVVSHPAKEIGFNGWLQASEKADFDERRELATYHFAL